MTAELHSLTDRGISAFKHYLGGKVLSGVSTFVFFLVVTRSLALSDYSDYITAIAVVELCIGLSSFGLDWLTVVKTPDLCANSKGKLSEFVANVIAIKFVAQTLFFICVISIAVFSNNFGIPERVLFVALFYVFTEGLNRFVATAIFDPMLDQKTSKLIWVVKSLSQLALLASLVVFGSSRLTASVVIALECAGSAIGLAIAFVALRAKFFDFPRAFFRAVYCPKLSFQLVRVEWELLSRSYVGSVLTWAVSMPTFVILARVVAGETGAAIVGFCSTLTNQIRRYLPTEMFIGVVRSLIYARYSVHRNVDMLGRDLERFLAAGVVVVLACLIGLAVVGDRILDIVSKGKFEDSLLPILLSVVGLCCLVARKTLETGANAVSAADLWMKATLASSVAVPIVVAGYLAAPSTLWFVAGWVLCDLSTAIYLHIFLCAGPRLSVLRPIACVRLCGSLTFVWIGVIAGQYVDSLEMRLLAVPILIGALLLYSFRTGLVSLKA